MAFNFSRSSLLFAHNCSFFNRRLLRAGRSARSLQQKKYHSSRSLKSCSSGPITLSVSQDNPLIDDILTVNISGLNPFQEITVTATTTSESKRKFTFGSFGHFKASVDGFVDLSRDPSLNGTYKGVEPMGLFWSMVQTRSPNQEEGQYAMLIKYNSTTPVVYNLAVFPQHVIIGDCLWRPDLKPLAQIELKRWYKKPNIKTISVDEDGIHGSLFLPEDRETDSPMPAVIDLYGNNGGLIESRAALLASRGFITFSLPYFLYKDLPESYVDVDFGYFQKAITWFVNHPSVLAKNGIGVLGASLGGTLSLYLAAHCPEVKAAISINGPPAFFLDGINHNGKKVAAVGPEYGTFEKDDQGILTNNWKIDETKIFDIPSSSGTKVLLLVGDDDKLVQTDSYKRWLERRNPMSKESDIELVVYPDTGHFIEPPYTPLYHTCHFFHYGCNMRFGGTSAPHALAQENAWFKIQEFFKKHL